MLSALLTIGKGIGIFLLILFLLLLFVLCLALFVPVRYFIKAQKQEEIKALCRASWLCRVISFCLVYDDGGLTARFRICGILWKKKEKPVPDVAEELKETAVKDGVAAEDSAKEETIGEPSGHVFENAEKGEAEQPGAKAEDPAFGMGQAEDTQTKQGKNSMPGRILDKIRKIWYTIASIYGKILQIKDNILKYLEIWHAQETQEAFSRCKQELVRLLRHIRPKKLKAEITFGMEDPALTGEILGAASIFYAYIGKNVLIHPDFENAVFTGNISAKGRIRAGTLLLIAGRLYFDKNVRKLIHEFRKERADGQ